MSNINWHRLKYTLLRGGVASKYVRRTIKELQQHHEDLVQGLVTNGLSKTDATKKADQEIGSSQTIAHEVLKKQELLTWAHRFPKLTLLAAPIITYPLLFLVLFFGTILLPIELFKDQLDDSSSSFATLISGALFFYTYLLAPLFLVGVVVFSRQRSVRILWPVLAIVVVAFIGSGLSYTFLVSSEPGQSSLGITWGYSFLGIPVPDNHTTWSLLRMIATILLCGLCMFFYRPLESDANAEAL